MFVCGGGGDNRCQLRICLLARSLGIPARVVINKKLTATVDECGQMGISVCSRKGAGWGRARVG